jgi:hypothetical protein
MKKPETKKKHKRAVKRKAAQIATKKLAAKQVSKGKKATVTPVVKKPSQKNVAVAVTKKVSRPKAKKVQSQVISKKVRALEILVGFSGFGLGGIVVAAKIPLFVKIFI